MAQIGLRSLMGFVIDNQVPINFKHSIVFVKFAANPFRAAQVLHRSKIGKVCTHPSIVPQNAVVLRIDRNIVFITATIDFLCNKNVLTVRSKYQIVVLLPSLLDYRAMGNYDCFLEPCFSDQLISRNRFPKPHFAIPKHSVIGMKDLNCALHSLLLFLPKFNRFLDAMSRFCRRTYFFRRRKNSTPFFICFDCIDRGFQINGIPFRIAVSIWKPLAWITRTSQNIVNILISEWIGHTSSVSHFCKTQCQFRVKQFIAGQCRLCVLLDSLMSCRIEQFTIGRKL